MQIAETLAVATTTSHKCQHRHMLSCGAFDCTATIAPTRHLNPEPQIREFLEKHYAATSGRETVKLAIRALMETVEASSKNIEVGLQGAASAVRRVGRGRWGRAGQRRGAGRRLLAGPGAPARRERDERIGWRSACGPR